MNDESSKIRMIDETYPPSAILPFLESGELDAYPPLYAFLAHVTAGDVTVEHLDTLLEATAKSARERIHRRSRVAKVGPKGHSMLGRVVPKKKGDCDPRQHRGKRNFRGSEKRSQDAEKRRHPEKYTEAIGFIRQYVGKPIADLSVAINEVRDVGALRKLVSGALLDGKIDNNWLLELGAALDTFGK